MKKLFLVSIISTIFSLALFSQAKKRYSKPQLILTEQYHGTHACFDSIIVDLGLDAGSCTYGIAFSDFYGFAVAATDYVIWDSVASSVSSMEHSRVEYLFDTSGNILRNFVYSKWQSDGRYYSSTNPSGYISSYTETDPQFNTKLAAKTTSDLSEGTNLYWTAARFDTRFGLKTTDNLTEGVVNLFFTAARARSAFSAGGGISITSGAIANTSPDQTVSISSGTGIAITGTYPNFTVINSSPAPILSIDTIGIARSFNSNFRPSTTKTSHVWYSIRIACSLSLSGGQYGTVVLQQSADGSTNWKEVARCENGNTGTLTIGLNTVQTQCFSIDAEINAGWYVKIVTTNTTGAPTFTYVSGREKVY